MRSVSPRHPFTCAQPVMPGLILSCRHIGRPIPPYCSSCSRAYGTEVDQRHAPLDTTARTAGAHRGLDRRKNAPSLVIRGSPRPYLADATCGLVVYVHRSGTSGPRWVGRHKTAASWRTRWVALWFPNSGSLRRRSASSGIAGIRNRMPSDDIFDPFEKCASAGKRGVGQTDDRLSFQLCAHSSSTATARTDREQLILDGFTREPLEPRPPSPVVCKRREVDRIDRA